MDLFTCPRHAGDLTITPATCAQMYRRGKRAEPWDACARCRGCEIGAKHAGEIIVAEPAMRECLRCGRKARRLIGNRLCLSCYNRERELITGHYRRKKPPAGLRLTTLSILLDGHPQAVQITAASPVEALRWAARQYPGRGVLAVSQQPQIPWRAACQWPQTSLLPGA